MSHAQPVLHPPRAGLAVSRPLPLLFCLLLLTGCRANCDLVEAELRTKEEQLRELHEKVDKKDCEIEALEREIELLHRREALKPGLIPDGAPCYVKTLTLGRLTGGSDEDPHCPGDEALQILVEPRDPDDQAIKAPGSLHVDVYEISREGVKSILSTWDLTSRELRRKWDTPIFGGPAYRVVLPWKAQPTTERLRVVVQFTTHDGKKFEADKDITIRLPERKKDWPGPKPAGPHTRPMPRPDPEERQSAEDGPELTPPEPPGPLHMPRRLNQEADAPRSPAPTPGSPDRPLPPPDPPSPPPPAAEVVPASYRPALRAIPNHEVPATTTGVRIKAPAGAKRALP